MFAGLTFERGSGKLGQPHDGKCMTMDKKQILFVVALILLVVSIGYRAMNPFEQARVETLTYTGEKSLSTRSGILNESRTKPHTVHDTVSRFIDPPLVSATVHQDLFAKYQPPRPSPSPETSPEPPLDAPPVEDPDQERRELIQEAEREISEYRIFGIFEHENDLFVFLTKGKQVIVAGKGDLLEDKYRIHEIEKTHIKIMAVKINEPIQLDMSDFFRG
jgi:hypothetical protein